MKLTKQQEKELLQGYETYWAEYLNGNVEAMEVLLDDSYTQVGSAESEVFTTKKEAIQFLRDTIQEVAGKLQMRNRSTKLESQEAVVLVHERCDLYALTGAKWVFYSKFRATTFLQEKKDGWKIIHQHSSFPDTKTEKGQNVAIDKIAEENQELRDAIKRRTIELEQKNRELEIEASVERVRSKAMAMQNSDELSELVDTVFKELTKLDLALSWCMINIIDEPSMSNIVWGANPEIGKAPESYHMLFEDYRFHHEMFKAWKEKKDKWVFVLKGAEKEIYDAYLFNETEFRRVPEAVQKEMRATKQYVASFTFSNFGGIQTVGEEPLSDESLDILRRFGKVFDLTYTRFNDLKQAEAQAREAQIETALERVRSRTMGMQKSEELKEVIQVVYEQFVHLNFQIEHTGFIIDYKTSDDMNIWLADQQEIQTQITLPYFDCAHWNSFKEAKEKGLDFFANHLDFEEKNRFYQDLFKLVQGLSEEAKEYYLSASGLAISTVLLDNIGLYIENFSGIPYTDEENKALMRFGKVFQQTYTRFLDLQKAEAQAREAQIEAVLEKVRSRSLAMHNSNEMQEVANTIHEQFQALGLELDIVGMVGEIGPKKDYDVWVGGSKFSEPVRILYNESTQVQRDYNKFIEKKSGIFTRTYVGKVKEEYINHLLTHGEHPPKLKSIMVKSKALTTSMTISKSSGIQIARYNDKAYTHEENQILIRFGKVFAQAYIRFLDLQRAEAQAREAQIETALERVRSKTMAMHNSQDVGATVVTLFDEVMELGLDKSIRCGIGILEGSDRMETWSATSFPNGEVDLKVGMLDMTKHPLLVKIKNSWISGNSSYTDQTSGKDVVKYYKALNNDPEYPFNVDLNSLPKKEFHNSFSFHEGIIFSFSPNPMSVEATKVFARFAHVFGQTYRRYLDLRKAEAQAKEAQIEAALERVRASSMAMHKSEDLPETAQVLFEQFALLGNMPDRISIGIIREDENIIELWATDQIGSQLDHKYSGPLDEATTMTKMHKAWKEGKDAVVVDLSGQKLKDWVRYIKEDMKMHIDDSHIKGRRVQQAAFFSKGMLLCTTNEPVADEIMQLLIRFAKVFNQTYTRFLDLQKVEAQAREAQIEAALEKVRGKAMAMHHSKDLVATASVVFSELKNLGIKTFRSGVGLLTKENKDVELYAATSSDDGVGLSLVGKATLKDHPVLSKVYTSWIKNEDYYPILEGDLLKQYYEQIESQYKVPATHIESNIQYGYFLPFSEGVFYGWSHEPLKEAEIAIMQRFNGIMDLTFRRYIELQKAETNALDAIRRSSVDRVRAEIASMRTTGDLERITPIIWNELTTLGVPFVRCGVFIFDEQEEQIHTFLSKPDGKAIAAFHLPYDSSPFIDAIENWRSKKIQIIHWDNEGFSELADTLIKEGQIATRQQYLSTVPKDGLYLHYVPFLQGILYVGNSMELDEDSLHLVQSIANAFSTAYARYEDFNKLEEAKQQVEKTLTDLKQTQQQLVQSEKMASLGELTAGIAHEIQNPLNFVNNFSEVSVELIEEMHEELEKGDFKEAMALAEDVKQNLDKITHHGKRADGIVKGMLQHSRSSSGEKEPTDINALADEYLRLAYHGLRAKDKSFNANMKTDFDENIGKINIIPQDIGRVVLNLITNAFYAVSERKLQQPENYEPTVTVTTKKEANKVLVSVTDNGNGIPKKVLDKIFQPFFTTKPTGQGTGLGLSLSYDIVKAHGGEITVKSKAGEGTTFTIALPA